MEPQDTEKEKLLQESQVIAIVGLSPDIVKASNVVGNYLVKAGYRIIPVNPLYEEIMGFRSYKSLLEIPDTVDIVDIFMRPDKVLSIVEEAVKLKPRAIWLQLGIVNEEARTLAGRHGIPFIQNLCIKQEHSRLFSDQK
jgi:predicted CoA-binding protein